MRASATAVVEAGGAVRRLRSQPPLTVRRVVSEPGTSGLCLVGSAAGPLPGDELDLDLDVADGADCRLQAAGASIAQGRGGPPASLRIRVRVGTGGCLVADPGPLIVCSGATVRVVLDVELTGTSALDWTETVVLGRSGEPGGRVVLAWRVHRGGRPLLVQTVRLGGSAWPGLLGGHRVLTARLRVGPSVAARTVVHDPAAVTQQLADHAELTTVLAPDTADAHRRLAAT